jgi:hypothetical protein
LKQIEDFEIQTPKIITIINKIGIQFYKEITLHTRPITKA